MSTNNFEALVVPGAGLTPQEKLTVKGIQRMDTGISAWEEGVAPNLVVSGGHSFMLDVPPSVSEAEVMERYALSKDIPKEAISVEKESLDTIGNALFTKTKVITPNNWEQFVVVTSRSHLPRTLKIFRHIMGPDFNVQGMPAPEHVTAKERIYELIGAATMREVLRGTKPGDHEAIEERLLDLVPGYAESTKRHLAVQSLLGIVKPR